MGFRQTSRGEWSWGNMDILWHGTTYCYGELIHWVTRWTPLLEMELCQSIWEYVQEHNTWTVSFVSSWLKKEKSRQILSVERNSHTLDDKCVGCFDERVFTFWTCIVLHPPHRRRYQGLYCTTHFKVWIEKRWYRVVMVGFYSRWYYFGAWLREWVYTNYITFSVCYKTHYNIYSCYIICYTGTWREPKGGAPCLLNRATSSSCAQGIT